MQINTLCNTLCNTIGSPFVKAYQILNHCGCHSLKEGESLGLFQQLPNELIFKIFASLKLKECKSLRLTSLLIHAFANERFQKKAYLNLSHRQLLKKPKTFSVVNLKVESLADLQKFDRWLISADTIEKIDLRFCEQPQLLGRELYQFGRLRHLRLFREQRTDLLQMIDKRDDLECAPYSIEQERFRFLGFKRVKKLEYREPVFSYYETFSFYRDCLKADGTHLSDFPEEMKRDKGWVLKAIQSNPQSFFDASAELQLDIEVILAAMKAGFKSYYFLKEELKDCEEFFLQALAIDEEVLKVASKKVRCSLSLALAIVKKNHWLLDLMSEHLKDDLSFFQAAIEIDVHVLQHATERVRNDRHLLFKALNLDSAFVFRYLSEALKSDEEFFLQAMAIDAGVFDYASDAVKNSPQILAWQLQYMSLSVESLKEAALKKRLPL